MTPEHCVYKLMELVPELRPILEEHVRDYDQLLPQVFFGDVTRYVVALARRIEPAAQANVAKVLEHLEACLVSGDEQVRELIGASFIENLFGEDVLAKLKLQMGPNLRRELAASGE